MWMNKSRRPAKCKACVANKTEEKWKYCECGVEKSEEDYPESMWKNKSQRPAKCTACVENSNMLKCDICMMLKPLTDFSESMLKHRWDKDRTVRCVECSNPPCMFSPNCETCPKCRRHNCRGGRICPQTIQSLPQKQLPLTKAEVDNYTCDKCAYVRCTVRKSDGALCGRMRRANAKAKARQNKETFQCGECQTWLFSQANLQQDRTPTIWRTLLQSFSLREYICRCFKNTRWWYILAQRTYFPVLFS